MCFTEINLVIQLEFIAENFITTLFRHVFNQIKNLCKKVSVITGNFTVISHE
jgi:hypothetical protein